MTSRTIVVLIITAILASGCGSDKLEAGRRLIDSEPEKALALFEEAEKEKGECFDCLIYTGLTYEKMGKEAHAITAYERAMAMPGAAARPEPVAERLLRLYEKAHGAAQNRDEKITIARHAAELEKSLKVARPWASMYLLDIYAAEMKASGEAGDDAAVRKAADFCMDLALPADAKNGFAQDATKALQTAFVVNTEKKFLETLAGPLAERGIYDAGTQTLTFRNQFTIPPKSAGPEFDPDQQGFVANVRRNACIPLHTKISETVKMAEPLLGLKNVDADGINMTFQDLYKRAVAGFAVHGGEKRAPNGQAYVCMIQVPLKDFLAAVFRFAE